MKVNLLDEIILTYIPSAAGQAICLYDGLTQQQEEQIVSSAASGSGMQQVNMKVRR